MLKSITVLIYTFCSLMQCTLNLNSQFHEWRFCGQNKYTTKVGSDTSKAEGFEVLKLKIVFV